MSHISLRLMIVQLFIAANLCLFTISTVVKASEDNTSLSKDAIEEICEAFEAADFEGVLEIAEEDGYRFEDIYGQIKCKLGWKGPFHILFDMPSAYGYTLLKLFYYFDDVKATRPDFDIASKVLNVPRKVTLSDGSKRVDTLLDYVNRAFYMRMEDHTSTTNTYSHPSGAFYGHTESVVEMLINRQKLIELGARTYQQQHDGTLPIEYQWKDFKRPVGTRNEDPFKPPEDCDTWYLLELPFDKHPKQAIYSYDIYYHIAEGNLAEVKAALAWCDTNPNRTEDSITPLMMAARFNQVESAKLLVQHPAINIHYRYKWDMTALDIAYLYNSTDMISYLRKLKLTCIRICEPVRIKWTDLPFDKNN